jgi:hypothetical protein
MADTQESLELRNRFETIDFETGELVNVLDSTLPVESRIDPAKWLIDRFTSEIELCKERKDIWNQREEVFKLGIDKIRSKILDDMSRESKRKITTVENTVFITEKDKLICTEDDISQEYKTYDVTLKDVDYYVLEEIIALANEYDLVRSLNAKIKPEKLPASMTKTIQIRSITFRKSPKPNTDKEGNRYDK